MKIWQQSLVASAVMALAACGGSSNGSDSNTPTDPAPGTGGDTAFGRVIDGYLEKAFVCHDGNNNGECENSENRQYSDAQGQFNLSGLNGKTLLANAIPSVTKDADDNGTTIKQAFSLMAPAGHVGNLTPFTTLQAIFEKQGLTEQQASQKLAALFSQDISAINSDFVASNNSQMKHIAQTLVDHIKEVSRLALGLDGIDTSNSAYKIQTRAWSQIDETALAKLNELATQNGDSTPTQLAALWLAEQPQLSLTLAEINAPDDNGGNNGGGNNGGDALAAPTNVTVDDANDIANWTSQADTTYQYKIGDGEWHDVLSAQLPITFDDRAEGTFTVRQKPANDSQQALEAQAAQAVTKTAFIKLDSNLNRLPVAEKHTSEDGAWVCTRDNRSNETVYWSASPDYHGNWEYDSRSTTNNKLIALNKSTSNACNFFNWQFPSRDKLESLVINSTWGYTEYFGFLTTSDRGYYVEGLSSENENQVVKSDGTFTATSQYAFLIPMRKTLTGAELVETLTAKITALGDLSPNAAALTATLVANASEIDSDKQDAVAKLTAATTSEDVSELYTDNSYSSGYPLTDVLKKANNALGQSDLENALTIVESIEQIQAFAALNPDNNITTDHTAELATLISGSDIPALQQAIANLRTLSSQIESKISFAKVKHAALIIDEQHLLATTIRNEAATQTTILNTQAATAVTLDDYAALTLALDNFKSTLSNNLYDLGSTTTQSSFDILGLINNSSDDIDESLLALQNNSSSELADTQLASNWNTVADAKALEAINSRTAVENNLATIDLLIAAADIVSKDALALRSNAEDDKSDMLAEQQALQANTQQLSSDVESINNSEDAQAVYNNAMTLLENEVELHKEIAALQVEINALQDYIDSANTPLSAFDQSVLVYLNSLNAQLNTAKQQAIQSNQQAFASYDAAWSTDGFEVSADAAQIKNSYNYATAYFKLDRKGRYINSTAKDYQGWSCIRQTDSVFSENRTWSILVDGSDNQKNGLNFEQAEQFVNDANTTALCGINDWRLPSTSELKSISTHHYYDRTAMDTDVFVHHLGNQSQYNEELLTDRYAYWTNEAGDNANKQIIYSFGTTSRDEIAHAVLNDDSLAESYTIATRLYRHDALTPEVTLLDDEGFRALADSSNAACARIGDTVWSLHTDALGASVKITPSNRDALITKMNDELTYCGVNNWQLPNQQQISAITLEPTLPFTVLGKDDQDSDYWLSTKNSYDDNHRFDTRRLMDTKGSTSSTYFRAIGTTAGEVQNPLPTPGTPTNPVENDSANTFAWDYSAGYTAPTDYEFSTDAGKTWTDASANPISVGDVFILAGKLQVRVKATETNKASNVLVSTNDYRSETLSNCVGGNFAAEVGGKCYIRIDSKQSWTNSLPLCAAEGAVPANHTAFDLAEVPAALGLTDSEYWLDEYSSTSGRTVKTSGSSWRFDYWSKNSSFYQFPVICER